VANGVVKGFLDEVGIMLSVGSRPGSVPPRILAALGGPLLAVVGPVAAVMAGTRLLWPALQRPTLRRLEAAALEVEESGRAATE